MPDRTFPPTPISYKPSRRLAPALLCAGIGVTALFTSPQRAAAQSAVSVNVQTDVPRSTVQPEAIGLNVAIWDSLLTGAPIPPLLKQAGVTVMRFPGGSSSDLYHWQNHSGSQGQYVDPNNTFDNFMTVVRNANAQAMITVNYGTDITGNGPGDPNEAAAWVDYSNNVKKYGVKFWEVGNEIYGNGFYGASWEPDQHADKSPTEYGKNVVKYVTAMKAKDPTIKVGAVLCSPGQWPDTQTPSWNAGVLAQCGSVIDFVIVHNYPQDPGQENDANLLQSPAKLVSYQVPKLQALINTYCGANAPNVKICVTEVNSVSSIPGKQTLSLVNAMFLADNYATWLEYGAANLDWWDLHNGYVDYGNNSASLYGSYNYGDYSILATFQSQEPGSNFPFPPFYGFEMLSHLARPGDQFVTSTSGSTLLGVHAARQANGSLAVLLINKDPNNALTANVSLSGYTPLISSTDYFYGKSSGTGGITSSVTSVGPTFSRTVPPYSLTTVVMQSNGSNPTPTPTPVPTPTPTPTPTPVPTPTPTPVPTPVPGTGYAVTYKVTSQWDGAFNADVTIKNTSTTAINGWTLGWTFAGNQKIVNLWGGKPVQNGQQVVVTNESYNGAIPAGGSVTFGFQATFSGGNTNPASFSFNGTGGPTPTPTPVPTPTPTPTPVPTPTPTPVPTPTPTPVPTPVPTPRPTPTSTPTPVPTPTPTPTPVPPAGGVQVTYAVGNQWQDGFLANVTIKNNGPAVNGWTLAWTFPGNQKITNLWNGNVNQPGKTVTVTNASYNGSIPAGGTVTLGFQATYSGTNGNPANFTFNGAAVTSTLTK